MGGTWDSNKCVPVLGSQAAGDTCGYDGVVAATDNCDAETVCWGVDAQGNGTCTPICSGSPDEPMCDEGLSCVSSNQGSVNLCVGGCDPLNQDCPVGEACYPVGAQFVCAATTEDIPVGEPCGFINDCAAGLSCVPGELLPDCEGSNCCAAFCDADNPSDSCDALPGTQCDVLFDPSPPGAENVGVCVLP